MTASIRLFAFFLLSSLLVLAQQKQSAPQTPRQALVEMMKGGEPAIKKHLTVEIQQMVHDLEQKESGGKDGKTGAATEFLFPGMVGGTFGFPLLGKDLKTFDAGNVFLSYKDRRGPHRSVEVHVDADDLRGDEDELQLSIHMFNEGQEQEIPYMPNLTIGMKRQEGVWRVNSVGGSIKAEIGNPKFFQALSKLEHEEEMSARQAKTEARPEPTVVDPSSTLALLALAETNYAQKHPDAGFTCNLSELLNDEGTGSGAFMSMLDPQIATGTSNGYRYSISGCESKPSEVFHLVAEPLAQGSGAKAFCINATHVLRVAGDGRGLTCLSSGRPFPGSQETDAGKNSEVHLTVK